MRAGCYVRSGGFLDAEKVASSGDLDAMTPDAESLFRLMLRFSAATTTAGQR
jgi:hypothetical protein